jgi:hypothetical protein
MSDPEDGLSPRAEREGLLYDYAVEHPDGFVWHEAMDDLGWTHRNYEFQRAVKDVRLTLADDEITLVCDPQGLREPWLYRLVGTYEEGEAFTVNRLNDSEARLETIEAVTAALVNATDGRSLDGRKARLIHNNVQHLRLQIQTLAEQDEHV